MQWKFEAGLKVEHKLTGRKGIITKRTLSDNGLYPAYYIRREDGGITKWSEDKIDIYSEQDRKEHKYKVGDRVYRGSKISDDYNEATITGIRYVGKEVYYNVKDVLNRISTNGWNQKYIKGLIVKPKETESPEVVVNKGEPIYPGYKAVIYTKEEASKVPNYQWHIESQRIPLEWGIDKKRIDSIFGSTMLIRNVYEEKITVIGTESNNKEFDVYKTQIKKVIRNPITQTFELDKKYICIDTVNTSVFTIGKQYKAVSDKEIYDNNMEHTKVVSSKFVEAFTIEEPKSKKIKKDNLYKYIGETTYSFTENKYYIAIKDNVLIEDNNKEALIEDSSKFQKVIYEKCNETNTKKDYNVFILPYDYIVANSGNPEISWDDQGDMKSLSNNIATVDMVMISKKGIVYKEWNWSWDCIIKIVAESSIPGWDEPSEPSESTGEQSADGWSDVFEPSEEEEEWKKEPLYDLEVKEEIKAMFPLPVLLSGPVGTLKSTTCMEIAEELGLKYYASVLTDQTSKNEFTGYKNVVDGSYVGTEFREAFEFGGLYVLEEINAATSNMPIIFNTIENGYFVFADKVVQMHSDFRLMATMNDITNAKDFGGRRTLDKSVRDRFHEIKMLEIPKDRFKKDTIRIAEEVNKVLKSTGVTDEVSPRDMRRYEKLISSKMDPIIAINKAMIKGKAELSEETISNIIKESKEWKDD